MKICIDCRVLNSKRTGGTGTYTRNLVNCLSDIDDANSYSLLVNRRLEIKKCSYMVTRVNYETHGVSEVWENTGLPFMLKKNKIALFHSPSVMLPAVRMKCRKIITVHDMVAFKFRQYFGKKYGFYVRTMTSMAVKSADRIIAVSQSTKNDIAEILSVKPEKIKVIHEGVNRAFRVLNKNSAEKTMKKNKIKKPFMLNVGTIEPRKNIPRLIEAYGIFRREQGGDWMLVIAGNKGWLYESAFRACEASFYREDIKIIENLSDDEITGLYNACEFFVYPSLYEGFGLPVIEAMACGAPVITSSSSSLAEIAGGAAVLINPEDPQELADAMLRVAGNRSLREGLACASVEKAKKYDWRNTALKTIETYGEAL